MLIIAHSSAKRNRKIYQKILRSVPQSCTQIPFIPQKHTPVQKSVLCISIVVLSLLSEFLLALAGRLFRFTAGNALSRIQGVARMFVKLL